MSERSCKSCAPPSRAPRPPCASACARSPRSRSRPGALSRSAPLHVGRRRLCLAPARSPSRSSRRGDRVSARRRRRDGEEAAERGRRAGPTPPATSFDGGRGAPDAPSPASPRSPPARPRRRLPARRNATRPSSGRRVEDATRSHRHEAGPRIARGTAAGRELQYDAPAEGIGGAHITLRIPSAKVEGALAELGALGRRRTRSGSTTCNSRRPRSSARSRRRSGGSPASSRSSSRRTCRTPTGLCFSRASRAPVPKPARLRQGLSGTRSEARTATVYLTLTTEEIEPGAVGGGSRLDRRQGRARVGGDRAPLRKR